MAIIGAGMVSLPENNVPADRALRDLLAGAALAVAAAACWGLSTVFGKWVTAKLSFPVTAFLRFAWGFAGISVLVALSLLGARAPANMTAPMYKAVLYMGLVPGVLALYLYYAGLKRTKASAATLAELFFPVAAVVINWRVLGQPLTATQLVGMGLLLLSVFFIGKGMR
ncbi:MAG: DMT family transporter [Deltaproteobacteria bacterium]|nr:DMT family transporter [Deltaproteobacteria bacterium]